MSDHIEHIKQYTAADIQQYLQGNMPPAEMHAMEKAALDDPFLADAIEGMDKAMQEYDEQVINGQLQEAKQQITNRTSDESKSAVVVPFRWWRVAAAAVVLIAGTVWVYNYFSFSKADKVARVENVKPQADTGHVVAAPDLAVNENKPPVTSAKSGSAVSSFKSSATEPSKELSPPLKRNTTPSPANKADTVDLVSSLATVEEKTEGKKEVKKAAPEPAKQAAREMEEIVVKNDDLKKPRRDTDAAKNLSGKVAGINFEENSRLTNVIVGRVTNKNNLPLANASLYVDNYRDNFYTDKSGLFKIPSTTDSIVDVSVAVNGYNTQRFRLQNNAVSYNQLRLEPDTLTKAFTDLGAISENNKAKDNNNNRRKASNTFKSTTSIVIQQAQPVYGWVAYEQYLEENKKRPADNANLKGEVVVSFMVDKKGNLYGFNIEQSLDEEYDDEAIRLVKEGPRWKSLNGRKSRVTIIVRF